uniref:WH2 domain-containing protein n=1 Tax=Timema tahoe TaxID=61484 RepID=A0A7R9FJZ0_9NEOP|nr:unnamed protein product [Timema tahoe]
MPLKPVSGCCAYAPPNPKPRRRPQQADSIGAFPRPIPRPRKLSIDLIESTEGSQTSEIVKTDELDYGMQEDLNDIKFVESNQNNDDTPDKESKEDTNNEEYNSFVENPPRDYTGGKELKIITKTKRDPKFDTFGLKSPTFQKSRKKWNFTDEQTLEHLSNVSIDGDYMVEETDTIFVVGSMVDNSEAEVFSPLSRPDVEPTFTRPNFRKSPTDSELEPQILRRSLNRDGRFPSSPKQWRDRKLDPTGSATSLRSMGEMPNFLGALANIGRWNNIEALHTAKEASPGWVLGDDDSGACQSKLEGDSQEEDAAADDELPHEPDSRPAVRHQRVSSKQELPRSSSSSQKPPGTPSVSPAALPPPDLVPQAAASSAEGPLDVIDWEYQLPAPPTAFRDTNSPALVEGETVVLADTGVFREEVTESSLDSGDFSLQDGDSFHPTRIHSRNLEQTRKEFAINGLEFDIQREGSFTKISRVNPLFDAQQFEIDSQRIDQPKSQSKVSDIGTLTKDKPKTADTIPQEIIRDEPHIQKDASRSSSNVSIHRPTIVLESNQSGQLSNFKITTYQMPREPDKLFEGEKEIFKKPLPVSNRSHRYGSVGSVSSFLSGDGLYCDLEGKKFTSYAALGYDSRPIRTKSVGNLAAEVAVESERRDARLLKMASQQNVNEDLKTPLLDETHLQQGHRQKDLSLQSLQVLRNILPQLTPRTPSEDSKSEDTDIRPVGDVTRSEEEKVAQQDTEFPISQESCSSPIHEPTALTPAPEKVSSAEKFYTYQGPPSINLSSWSERPKVKVDIKADSDYRIGRGKDTHVETPKTESAREVPRAEAKLDVRRSCVNSADGSQILKEVAPPESSPPPTKVESTPLTMRLVSHNSVSSSKKSLSTSQILESIARENPLVVGATAKEPTLVHVIPSFLSPAQRADPSRVPIVRAVELKKPYKQQLQDNDSNLNVSINIVRKNEELLVNNSNNNNNGYISRTISSTNQSKEENPRTDSDSFTGVNSLAKKFSSGVPLRSNALGPKPFQPRAVSSYEFNNKDINKVYLNDNLQKTQGGHNILVKSSSTSNVSGPNVTVTSYDGSRRFTSVVGINKTLGPPPHGVAKTTEGASTQNIHQRPSGSSIVKVNGFTGARQPFMPVVKGFQFTPQGSDASTVSVKVEQQPLSTEVNAPKVRIQRSESAAYKSARNQNSVSINQTGYGSTERFIGNEASVKIQPGWRTGGVIQPKLSRSVSNASSVPPPPPPLMSGVVLRKTPQSRPKSFSFANPRDELMDAIRSHGGRERLRKVGSSGHSSLNVILKV